MNNLKAREGKLSLEFTPKSAKSNFKLIAILKRILIFGVLIIIVFFLAPLPSALKTDSSLTPTRILDRNGKILYEVRKPSYGSQGFLKFDSIPKIAISALISVEDRSFMSHWGIRPFSIVRALWQNFTSGKIISGGSTITQQYIRIRLQPKKRGYLYKFSEMMLALKIETRMSKDEILEGYFNGAYFGQQAYGLEAASKSFFAKEPGELSLAETTFIIGLLQSPSGYDPYKKFQLAKARQKTVLQAMKATGVISTKEYEEALQEPLELARQTVQIKAPHFVFWVLQQLGKNNLTELRTTLDLDLQTEIENIVENELEKLKKKNVSSAAVVVLDVHTGEILSMVGSADYFDTQKDGQVNVAISSRQPGSALKPFTYALALAKGQTLSTQIEDVETMFFTQEGNPYIPRNYDYGFHGLVRYREALANSYNIPAVKTLEHVGVASLQGFLQEAGITTLKQKPEFYGVALTLGSGEVKLLELAKAYGIFPRGGQTLSLKYLLSDNMRESKMEGTKILDEKIAWLITDILSDNEARIPEFGENSALSFSRPVAAKTGTTRNSRDNWVIGFTPDRIVGVWVGNADNSPMRNTSGVTGAGPIFHAVMEIVNKNIPPKSFKRPAGLTQVEVCKLSGMLPSKYCPYTEKEWFIRGTEPKRKDDLYQVFRIDKRNNLLAGKTCDEHFTEEKVFIDFPAKLEKWARENGYKTPPREYSPLCGLRKNSKTPRPNGSSSGRAKLPAYWQAENNPQPQTINPKPLTITKPQKGNSFKLDPLIPDKNEQIIFEARADKEVKSVIWILDGEEIGKATYPDFRLKWTPVVGRHEISAQSPDLNSQINNLDQMPSTTDTIWIEVTK